MAILNNLLVNGAGRILNKLYCNDLEVSGDLVTDKITSATGTSYISLQGGTGNYFFGGGGLQLGTFSGYYVGSNYERYYTLGVRNGTIGVNSYVFGISSEASGTGSIALGTANTSSNDHSVTIGYGNTSSDSYAIAIGRENKSSGFSSVSLGAYNTSSSDRSVSIGYYLVAAHNFNTVIGKFNKATVSGSGTTAIYSNVGDYAFTIGNGTANTTAGRSNALTVDWSGNMILSGSLTCTNVHPVYHHTVTSASDVCTITHNLNISGTYYPIVQVCSASSALFVYGVRNCTANSFQVLLGCIDGYNPQSSNGKSVTLAWTY